MRNRRKPPPVFERGDRVLILTQHWRSRGQRGTVKKAEWSIGCWRYAVRLDGRLGLTRYNRTSLRLLNAIELLGELA